MKLKYLGDSRDSFKWDYHDYLNVTLGYPMLNVALMMTPDDNTNNGTTEPETFPARPAIIDFCRDLRNKKDIQLIRQLPSRTGADYTVVLHREATQIMNTNRRKYFSGIVDENRQVLFLDPDNGFEPEKKYSDKHVLYSDIETILQQVSEKAVISVFQYFRRLSFPTDFMRIRQRMMSGHATALYWHSLMFVAISKSKETIDKVRTVNRQYSQGRPVSILQ
jgi:hypothetical protein